VQEELAMPPKIIVSYDDTDNDRDALELGRLLASSGGDLLLAYVRHSAQVQKELERLAEEQAQTLLEHGAQLLGKPETPQKVVVNASTGDGLLELAEAEQAAIVAFGADYRTARGAVLPGKAAQRLLHGGTCAVALAPADFRSRTSSKILRIAVISEGDDAPIETAKSLAGVLGASLTDTEGPIDLMVIGSRDGTPSGVTELGALAEYQIETTNAPVLVVARDTPVSF
jgi:nucleotide-binding universal stress UspA family protein